MSLRFSDEKLKEVQRIIERYPQGKQKSAVIPVLHLAQQEFGGWLSTETMDYVASVLNLKPIEVYEVATFYSMFNLKPVGKYMFEVCQAGPCMLNGSDDMFTLKTVECLGACGYAPMMQQGKYYKEQLTKEKIDAIIAECRNAAAAKN